MIVMGCLLNEYLQLNVNCNNINSHISFPVQENSTNMLESVNLVKRAMCTMTLPIINTTLPHPFAYAVVTFCKSNNTVFEASLLTLNQVCVYLCILEYVRYIQYVGLYPYVSACGYQHNVLFLNRILVNLQ